MMILRFQGQWNTTSALQQLDAPLGEKLFGGEKAYQAAQRDFNFSLIYLTRFKTLQNGTSPCP